jgi:hypothetical protein
MHAPPHPISSKHEVTARTRFLIEFQPDTAAVTCQSPKHSPTTSAQFTFFRRRHHCRRCGDIFCSAHAPHAVPLDQHARFHPEGSPHRACDACWADFCAWATARASRSNSGDSSDSNLGGAPAVGGGTGVGQSAGIAATNGTPLPRPTMGHRSSTSVTSAIGFGSARPHPKAEIMHPEHGGSVAPEGFRVGSLAGSVPRDWNWSTF